MLAFPGRARARAARRPGPFPGAVAGDLCPGAGPAGWALPPPARAGGRISRRPGAARLLPAPSVTCPWIPERGDVSPSGKGALLQTRVQSPYFQLTWIGHPPARASFLAYSPGPAVPTRPRPLVCKVNRGRPETLARSSPAILLQPGEETVTAPGQVCWLGFGHLGILRGTNIRQVQEEESIFKSMVSWVSFEKFRNKIPDFRF
ncbi:uncharacterized protein LOC104845981 [Loxodonta africana]|uniref:uncharacterized protein LOC104845981 n=1 Tax=Loxodonta africana TaxID=9785 RepID=UPI0030D51A29